MIISKCLLEDDRFVIYLHMDITRFFVGGQILVEGYATFVYLDLGPFELEFWWWGK